MGGLLDRRPFFDELAISPSYRLSFRMLSVRFFLIRNGRIIMLVLFLSLVIVVYHTLNSVFRDSAILLLYVKDVSILFPLFSSREFLLLYIV